MKLSRIPFRLIKNFVGNVLRVRTGNQLMAPYFTTFYLTLRCNYACAFCDDGTAAQKYPEVEMDELDTEQVKTLLTIIRKRSPSIYFTGGEPFMRQDLIEICRYAKQIGFYPVSLNTNGALIHKKIEVLDYIDNLVVSLPSIVPETYARIIQKKQKYMDLVIQNILTANAMRKKKGFALTANCVVTGDSLQDAGRVMSFCFENDIHFAIVPALKGVYPDESLNCIDYRQLIDEVVENKRRGKPVPHSYDYLNIIKDFKKFKCWPLMTPHVYPDGSLFYPCQMLKSKIDLLKIGDYDKAIKEGREKFGDVPDCDNRCHLACYVEPSITTARPSRVLDFARYI